MKPLVDFSTVYYTPSHLDDEHTQFIQPHDKSLTSALIFHTKKNYKYVHMMIIIMMLQLNN